MSADDSPERLRPARAASMRRRLLRWYDKNGRDLPWRGSGDPYAIWVSEVMLQQTTVAAVAPYWTRFMERFPTVETLARARLDDVLAAWSGLGYYRRARYLHRAARIVARDHAGRLPESVDELRRLPGVGEYTAAAVASIAFGAAAAVVDGNVTRCLSRLACIGGDPGRQPARGAVRRLAEDLLDRERPGDHNQALMELGATVCTARRPRCGICPWSAACLAHARGAEDEYPAAAARPRAVDVVTGHVLVRRADGRLLLRRVPDGRPNAGMIELPSATLHHGEQDRGPAPRRLGSRLAARLERRLAHECGLAVEVGEQIATEVHGITRHRIRALLVEGRLAEAPPAGRAWIWSTPHGARRRALTAVARRLLARIGDAAGREGTGRAPRAGRGRSRAARA